MILRHQLSHASSSLGSLCIFILGTGDQFLSTHKGNARQCIYSQPMADLSLKADSFKGPCYFLRTGRGKVSCYDFPTFSFWECCGPRDPEVLRSLTQGPIGNATGVFLGPSSDTAHSVTSVGAQTCLQRGGRTGNCAAREGVSFLAAVGSLQPPTPRGEALL